MSNEKKRKIQILIKECLSIFFNFNISILTCPFPFMSSQVSFSLGMVRGHSSILFHPSLTHPSFHPATWHWRKDIHATERSSGERESWPRACEPPLLVQTQDFQFINDIMINLHRLFYFLFKFVYICCLKTILL